MGLAGIILGIFCIAAVVSLLLATPSVEDAALLTQAHMHEHDTPYPGPRLPSRFVKALVATEDHRFYSLLDPGVDPFAVVRAAIALLTLQRGDPGGSTLTQQLARLCLR